MDLACVAADVPSSNAGKNNAGREIAQSSMNVHNKNMTNFKINSFHKASPVNWFPRKKVESYLNRKIKLLQELGGMNSTLDETLCDSNPHYSKLEKEMIAAKKAAQNVVSTRKIALIEASWCRILQATRIQSKEAESVLSKAEKNFGEAYDAAMDMGLTLYDIQKPAPELENASIHGGESSHAVAPLETAFEVDKEVAFAIKTALTKIANKSSRDKLKELLREIRETPRKICDSSSSDSEWDKRLSKDPDMQNLVNVMYERLKYLKEEELTSLATVVATCGLSAALAEVGNNKNGRCSSCERFKKHENPILDIKNGRRSTCERFKKHEHENPILGIKNGRRSSCERVKKDEIPSLDMVLVKHVSKLEREVMEAKKESRKGRDFSGKENRNRKFEAPVGGGDSDMGLDKCLVKHVGRLEREKTKPWGENTEGEIADGKNRAAKCREAREREMESVWGGLSLGNSIRPGLSRLEREKAEWKKAEADGGRLV